MFLYSGFDATCSGFVSVDLTYLKNPVFFAGPVLSMVCSAVAFAAGKLKAAVYWIYFDNCHFYHADKHSLSCQSTYC